MSSDRRRRRDVVWVPEPIGEHLSSGPRRPPAPVAWVVVLAADAEIASWPIPVERCCLAVVDDFARLALAVKRAGLSIQLRAAPTELRELMLMAGLGDLLGLPPAAV